MAWTHSARVSKKTAIIALAAAASIAAAMAAYYAAEAEKNYHLSNAALTTTAVRYEHQADLQARHDEELFIQATTEYHNNKTQIGDFVASQVSQEAKDNMVFDKQSNTFSLTPKYTMMSYTQIISTLLMQNMITSTALRRQMNILDNP
jgi:predicted RNA-binding protein